MNIKDGANGPGNRRSIAIEICFSRSGGTRFNNAERNAAIYVAQLLRERNWGVNRVFTHQHFDPRSQNCPHRTMANGWQRFINMVQAELNRLNNPTPSTPNTGNWSAGNLNADVRVTSDTLNVRSARNATSNIVRTLRRGDIVRVNWILGINDANPIDTPWGGIDGGAGFINMNFVERVANRTHTVVKGDTLWGISQQHNTTVEELQRINNMKTTTLSIGQVLQLPN